MFNLPDPTFRQKVKWKFKDIWYKISCFFNPGNKWLTKVIPKIYRDKDELIKLVLFKCLVDYVEEEKCFEIIDWNDDELSLLYKECIEYCYHTITVLLPDLEKVKNNIHYSWTEDEYKIYKEASDHIELLEQKTCEMIVSIREVLWT